MELKSQNELNQTFPIGKKKKIDILI